MARRLILLGSTGSIGTQTLDVVRHLNQQGGLRGEPIEVVGLVAGSNADLLAQQAVDFGVEALAIASPSGSLPSALAGAMTGVDAAERLVREVKADIVLAAMVGSAGLPATMCAVERGVDVALANKETLVAAGSLVIPAASASGARLFPVDSEHAAVWQCLRSGDDVERCCPPMVASPGVRKITLTASGGPFRTWDQQRVYNATAKEALAHPTWQMGPKVTIDSASLTNKAFEVIEAHWLFGLENERIDVLVHPQSLVHSFVEFADGNIIAQLGAPDMRLPIQYAMTYPDRPAGIGQRLDLQALSQLTFEPPDLERFPALKLAEDVIERGGTSGAIFNAANEIAVEAFIGGMIPFGRISEVVHATMDRMGCDPVVDLAGVLAVDGEARRIAREMLGGAVAAQG